MFSFERIWSYIGTQWSWFIEANGRIFSNLSTCLIDSLPLAVRAACYAFVVILCCYLVLKLANSKIETSSTLLLFALMVSISYGIKYDIYYYATGLYLGAFLLILLSCHIIKRTWNYNEDSTERFYKISDFIVFFLASAWMENITITLFFM